MVLYTKCHTYVYSSTGPKTRISYITKTCHFFTFPSHIWQRKGQNFTQTNEILHTCMKSKFDPHIYTLDIIDEY